jgi:hypothetical protein
MGADPLPNQHILASSGLLHVLGNVEKGPICRDQSILQGYYERPLERMSKVLSAWTCMNLKVLETYHKGTSWDYLIPNFDVCLTNISPQ